MGEELNLIDKDRFELAWIVDFPMYEYDETEKKIDFSHNPFSMPQGGLEALQMVHLRGPLRLATHTLDSPYVLLAPGRCRVGTLSLRRFDVSIDRDAQRVRLSIAAPPANSP